MVFGGITIAIVGAQTILWSVDWCPLGGMADPATEMDSTGWCIGSQFGGVCAGLVV